ncbi:MAG: glycosyltransferase family 4 protein [Candidatus Delongbacteria bacterium]|jgi:glycosyltransferase involved in cell wall biosynthesis|nr:glycosyltransferase family 4 protein [Candidatus Delongbacteria bacterium]MDY0018107.1 glycosyltransferase family 4 protein [Candidatus Delongbacteria bacterium]
MRILMFTWEFPPLISGGLGTACYGIVKGLLKKGVEVDLVLPTREEVYFPLRKVSDVDDLPVKFISPAKEIEYTSTVFKDSTERYSYIGISSVPESYISVTEVQTFYEYFKNFTQKFEYKSRIPFNEVLNNIMGSENIFEKVKEFTFRAQRYAQALEYDLIHAHDWLTYPAGIIAKTVSGKKLVCHMHATEFDRAGGAGDERIHKIEYSGMTEADSVIAVSKYTAEMVISRYQIDTGKINVVHNAHNINIQESEDKKRIFKDPVVLFLGRITLQKGPDYFLEAARIILSRYPKVRFVMAGAGDMETKIVHKSAKYRLKNRFLFTGFLNAAHVAEMFLSSDIYVLSSVSEPFGIAPLEAMSYGLATIISKQSGVAEVINNAIKIDFWDVKLLAEQIIRLIEDPAYRKDLGEKGRHEVEQIKWDSACDEIIKVYNKTAGR